MTWTTAFLLAECSDTPRLIDLLQEAEITAPGASPEEIMLQQEEPGQGLVWESRTKENSQVVAIDVFFHLPARMIMEVVFEVEGPIQLASFKLGVDKQVKRIRRKPQRSLSHSLVAVVGDFPLNAVFTRAKFYMQQVFCTFVQITNYCKQNRKYPDFTMIIDTERSNQFMRYKINITIII